MTAPVALATHDLHKRYGGVHALRGASLTVHAGEIHALLGENGTGKSTMMRILAGVETADAGRVELLGREVSFGSPNQARAAGIGIVFQELSLFPALDVLANLYAGSELRRAGFIRRAAMADRAATVLERLGVSIPLNTPVDRLSLAERQLIEIGKALLHDARLLILDEPNSALDDKESQRLFDLIRDLRGQGVASIYISHRLEEVMSLADRVSVMREGRVTQTVAVEDASMSSLVRAMLGREVSVSAPAVEQHRTEPGGSVVQVRDISAKPLRGVSLDIRQGHVLGMVGLQGAGQTELLRVLFGDLKPAGGTMTARGRPWAPRSPRQAARDGVAFVPSDRTLAGLMMSRSVADNIGQVAMEQTRSWIYRPFSLQRRANERISQLNIRVPSAQAPVESLSGGNQQKVVLAKWLEVDPWMILLDDPTRGVDVGGKSEIYNLITALAASGKFVIFTSTEAAEYSQVCDSVCVFRSGRITARLAGVEMGEHQLTEAINAVSH